MLWGETQSPEWGETNWPYLPSPWRGFCSLVALDPLRGVMELDNLEYILATQGQGGNFPDLPFEAQNLCPYR